VELEVQEHQIRLQEQILVTLAVVEVEQEKENLPLLQQLEDLEVLAVEELEVAQDYQEQRQVQFQDLQTLEEVEVDLETQQGKILLTKEQEQVVQVSLLQELLVQE
jgi:translation elongation factor P/translation initiation factor 5A